MARQTINQADIDIMSELANSGVIDSQFQIRSPVLHGERVAELEALAASAGGGTSEQWDEYARSRSSGFWNATFSFFGPEPVVSSEGGGGGPYMEAREALTGLGYSLEEAEKALNSIPPQDSVEQYIKEALRRIGSTR